MIREQEIQAAAAARGLKLMELDTGTSSYGHVDLYMTFFPVPSADGGYSKDCTCVLGDDDGQFYEMVVPPLPMGLGAAVELARMAGPKQLRPHMRCRPFTGLAVS